MYLQRVIFSKNAMSPSGTVKLTRIIGLQRGAGEDIAFLKRAGIDDRKYVFSPNPPRLVKRLHPLVKFHIFNFVPKTKRGECTDIILSSSVSMDDRDDVISPTSLTR